MTGSIPETQVAWRMVAENRPKITRQVVPVPEPRDHEVLIKVSAAGICHSEFTLLHPEGGVAPPYTLGHEICGVAVKLGSEATKINPSVKLGSRYNVYSINSCQQSSCHFCSIGQENLCDNALGMGYGMGTDGGFTSYVRVTARSLCLVPDNVTDGEACSATDACMTGYAAARTSGATTSSIVLCIGIGGVGSMAIQTAKHVVKAKTVIAVDLQEWKLPIALKLGADHAVLSKDLTAFLEKEGIKPDVAIDCVARQETLTMAAECLAKQGILKIVGMHSLNYTFGTMTVMVKQLEIRGSYGGTFKDHCDCLTAVGDGLLTPAVEVRKMDDIEQALLDLDAGKVQGRVVLTP